MDETHDGSSVDEPRPLAASANGSTAVAAPPAALLSTAAAAAAAAAIPPLTPLGLHKSELTRLLIQELDALDFPAAARALEAESGIVAHAPALARLRAAVLDGGWAALAPGGDVWALVAPLFESPDAARAARFLMARQQFLELLESGRGKDALACLRTQVRPAARCPEDLHRLPLLYMCRSAAEVRERAGWAGAGPASRHALLASLRLLLPPRALLPELRLETLLAREVLRQRAAALWPYVSSPHTCFIDEPAFAADTLPTAVAA
ncbi:hypothetical protein BU14_2027s0002, partial [Porphyra umbilicalis]